MSDENEMKMNYQDIVQQIQELSFCDLCLILQLRIKNCSETSWRIFSIPDKNKKAYIVLILRIPIWIHGRRDVRGYKWTFFFSAKKCSDLKHLKGKLHC